MSVFVQYNNNSSHQFYGTYVSECAAYTDTQSYQMQLSYASYYILVYHDKMLITITDNLS